MGDGSVLRTRLRRRGLSCPMPRRCCGNRCGTGVASGLLRGWRTPRQAAHGKERPLLEALLRQFEYEADLLAAEGKAGVDTGWLRNELAMVDDLDG